MDIKRKKELAWLESLDDLDPESKALAERELFSRYPVNFHFLNVGEAELSPESVTSWGLGSLR